MKRKVGTSAGSASMPKKPKNSVLHKVVRLLEDVTESELAQLKALVLVRSASAKFRTFSDESGVSDIRSCPHRRKPWTHPAYIHDSSSVQEVVPEVNETEQQSTPARFEQAASSCEIVNGGGGWTDTQSFDFFQDSRIAQSGDIPRNNFGTSTALAHGDCAPQQAIRNNCVQDFGGELAHFSETCATPREPVSVPMKPENVCSVIRLEKTTAKANSVEEVSLSPSHMTAQETKTSTRNVSKKNKSFMDHPDYIALRVMQDELLNAKKGEKVNTLWQLPDTSFVGKYLFAQMKWHLRKECSRARSTIVRRNCNNTAANPDSESQSAGHLRRKALSECMKLAKRCGGLSALENRSDDCLKFFRLCRSSFLFTLEEIEGMRVSAASGCLILSSKTGKTKDDSLPEGHSEHSGPTGKEKHHAAKEKREEKRRSLVQILVNHGDSNGTTRTALKPMKRCQSW